MNSGTTAHRIGYRATMFVLFVLLSLVFINHKPMHTSAACAAQDTSRGTVTSTFSVATAGTYRVWSRILTPDTTNNSYILEIDGTTCGVIVGDNASVPANTWTWVDYQSGTTTNKINVTLAAGSHTMTLIGREDNVEVDRVVLTADTACVPTGTGDNCASPPDTTPPTVSLTAPTTGSIVSGTTTVQATASDDVALSKVEFYVDGALKSTDTTAAYSYSLDTTTLSNGNHTIYAIAYDTSSNHTQSSSVTVTVSNAPTCTANSTTAVTAPSGLTKASSNYTTIGLSWTASTPSPGCTMSGYDIYRNGTKVGTSTTTTYTDTGLSADGSYRYTVLGRDSGANSSAQSTSAQFTTLADNLAPNVPSAVAATAPSAGSVSVTWTAPADLPNPGGSGVTSYVISRTTGTGTTNPTSFTVAAPASSYTDTTVVASTKYNYSVAAVDKDANQSAPSTIVSATTPAPTCSGTPTVPAGLTTGATSVNSISFSWTASTASAGCTLSVYNVYRGATLIGSTTGTATSYTDSTGLLPNTSYSYTVVATDTSGHKSAASSAKVIATAADTSAPTAPGTVTALASSTSTVGLTWTASTDNVAVSGYKIYRDGTVIKTSTGTALSYSDTTAVADTDYVYEVSAYDASGNESTHTTATPNPVHTPASNDTSAPTTSATPPTTPTIAAQNATVSWSPASDNVGVVGYHIYVNGAYALDTTATTVDLRGTSYCLAPNVVYTVAIRAFDAAGNMSAPQNDSFTTLSGGYAGDLDCNGAVDRNDLFTLVFNYQKSGVLPAKGDVVKGDAIDDRNDLFQLVFNYGKP